MMHFIKDIIIPIILVICSAAVIVLIAYTIATMLFKLVKEVAEAMRGTEEKEDGFYSRSSTCRTDRYDRLNK